MHFFRRLKLFAVVTGAAALLVAATPAMASSAAGGKLDLSSQTGAAVAGTFYRDVQMVGWRHQRCLDAATQTLGQDGGIVQVWGCRTREWQNQRWQLEWMGNGWEIRNQANGKCLDADLNTWHQNGSRVQLWSCNNWDNQRWSWDRTAWRAANGKCVDVDANWIEDGAVVQLWDCNDTDQQRWRLYQD